MPSQDNDYIGQLLSDEDIRRLEAATRGERVIINLPYPVSYPSNQPTPSVQPVGQSYTVVTNVSDRITIENGQYRTIQGPPDEIRPEGHRHPLWGPEIQAVPTVPTGLMGPDFLRLVQSLEPIMPNMEELRFGPPAPEIWAAPKTQNQYTYLLPEQPRDGAEYTVGKNHYVYRDGKWGLIIDDKGNNRFQEILKEED